MEGNMAVLFPLLTFGFFAVLSLLALLIFIIAFWVWMFVDCLSSDLDNTNKAIWVILMFVFGIIGSFAYSIIARKRRKVTKLLGGKKQKRLLRSKSNRVIAGICGGIGEYFDVDPTVVRLLWVLFTLVGGSGILAYIICWVIIPEGK